MNMKSIMGWKSRIFRCIIQGSKQTLHWAVTSFLFTYLFHDHKQPKDYGKLLTAFPQNYPSCAVFSITSFVIRWLLSQLWLQKFWETQLPVNQPQERE